MMQLRDKSQAIRRRLKLDELDSGHSDERSQKICPTNRDKVGQLSGSILPRDRWIFIKQKFKFKFIVKFFIPVWINFHFQF